MKSQFKKVFSLYMYKEVELITDNRFSGNLYIKIKKPISGLFLYFKFLFEIKF